MDQGGPISGMLVRGIGRGRGRARSMIRTEVKPPLERLSIGDITERRKVELAAGASSSSQMEKFDSDSSGRDAVSDVSDDTIRLGKRKYKLNIPVGTGADVPVDERILNLKDIPCILVSVDTENCVGYFMCLDEKSCEYREYIGRLIQDHFQCPSNRKPVHPNEIKKGGTYRYVVADESGKYHRAIVLSNNSSKETCRLFDLDTSRVFIGRKTSFFQMDPAVSKYFYQVLACRFVFENPVSIDGLAWMHKNGFIFKDESMIEKALLSTVEASHLKEFRARFIALNSSRKIVDVSINVLNSPKLKEIFLNSLTFSAVPRIPATGDTKTGFITNVNRNGTVDVVFMDPLHNGLKDALICVQLEFEIFGPRSPNTVNALKDLILKGKHRHFISPYKQNWNEIHRVKITKVEETTTDDDQKSLALTLHYLDTGKQIDLPVQCLDQLGVPTGCSGVPEVLRRIPPQAINVRLNRITAKSLNTLKEWSKNSLESQPCPCFVKTVSVTNDASKLPIVEIFIECNGGVRNILDAFDQASNNLVPETKGATVESNEINISTLKFYEERSNAARRFQKGRLDAAMKAFMNEKKPKEKIECNICYDMEDAYDYYDHCIA